MSDPPIIRWAIAVWAILSGLWGQPVMATDEILRSSVAKEYENSVDVVIIEAVAQRLNARVVIHPAPFKRRLHLMQSGQLDFIVGLLKRPEREAFIHFVEPPYKHRSDTIFFVRHGRAAMIRTFEDLYPLRIGTILGSNYFPRFDDDPRLTKEPVHDSTSNLKKLISGRIDTAVFPESVGIDLIHMMGIAGQVAIADYRYAQEKHVYIGISRKSRLMHDIDTVEKTIRTMIEDGQIQQLIVDHYTRNGLPVPVLH